MYFVETSLNTAVIRNSPDNTKSNEFKTVFLSHQGR